MRAAFGCLLGRMLIFSLTQSDFIGCSQFLSYTTKHHIVTNKAVVNDGFNLVSLIVATVTTKMTDAVPVILQTRPCLRDILGLSLAEREHGGQHVWKLEVPP
jgi:hypothetical protein